MAYQFYPRKDDPCPNVGHCPHVGGAAIASLVLIGNENQLYLRQLHGTIDAEKERNRRLFEENERLSKELEQVKLELKLERQNKFATNKQKQTDDQPDVEPPTEKPSKKRGAPVGHPGWFRPMPTQYDWDIDVPAQPYWPISSQQSNLSAQRDRHQLSRGSSGNRGDVRYPLQSCGVNRI